MSKKPVAVNYTAEQTLQIITAYKAGECVESIAESTGRTARSIIAKLSREGVYTPKAYVTKNGEAPRSKDSWADAIGKVLRLTEGEVESLTKANKTALTKIFEALAASKPL